MLLPVFAEVVLVKILLLFPCILILVFLFLLITGVLLLENKKLLLLILDLLFENKIV